MFIGRDGANLKMKLIIIALPTKPNKIKIIWAKRIKRLIWEETKPSKLVLFGSKDLVEFESFIMMNF